MGPQPERTTRSTPLRISLAVDAARKSVERTPAHRTPQHVAVDDGAVVKTERLVAAGATADAVYER